jgi:hypothetical protein
VEVENVNLAAGTVLNVSLTHAGTAVDIGLITLSALHEGELELNSQDGATVPAVQAGDIVTLSNGAAAVATGIFN